MNSENGGLQGDAALRLQDRTEEHPHPRARQELRPEVFVVPIKKVSNRTSGRVRARG